jgi:hypothetical protein
MWKNSAVEMCVLSVETLGKSSFSLLYLLRLCLFAKEKNGVGFYLWGCSLKDDFSFQLLVLVVLLLSPNMEFFRSRSFFLLIWIFLWNFF